MLSYEQSSSSLAKNKRASQGSLTSQMVRVSDRSPSKLGSRHRKSHQQLNAQSNDYYYCARPNQANQSEILDRQHLTRPSIINKTAVPSDRKAKFLTDETTQKLNFKDIMRPQQMFSKVATMDRLPEKQLESSQKQNAKTNRSQNLPQRQVKHSRNASSKLENNIMDQIKGFFFGSGGTKEAIEQASPGGEHDQADESWIYQETEHNPSAFDNKMHPTKMAEKNWIDPYKLSQLIAQQE